MVRVVTLRGHYENNGDLVFEISGDLPESSIRSEGQISLDIVENKVVWKKNNVMFPQGFMVSGGRGLLSAIFCFHPTLSAIGSKLELGIQDESQDEEERITVKTNLPINEKIRLLLSNMWMLPKLKWEIDEKTLGDSIISDGNPTQPLAYGAGLDSGAAIAMFGKYSTPYHIVTLDSEVRQGTESILEQFGGCLCETNVKLAYSISGFPHWCCPYIPALLAGSTTCSTGTIIESQFLRDEKEYNDSRNNLWLESMRISGLIPTPIYFHSEYNNARIISHFKLEEVVAGNCIEEWGYSKKALRKAVLLAPFNDRYIEVIEELEANGVVLDPKSTYSEDSKMLSSITLAASLIKNPGKSITVRNLQSITGFRGNPWVTRPTLKA